ncbi:MAG: HD domain-containing protein [Desulfurococcales archaeon]|nr:HD domain-containing protein [Desulfurococcales archaeon]
MQGRASAASLLGAPRGEVAGLEWLEDRARALMGGDPAHGWPHVLRVARWASRIIEGEGVEPRWRILYPALLLHDVGRAVGGGGHHAVESARVARGLLEGALSPGELEGVVHAILAHSYSLGVRAESLEAMILSDADKLDALGAVGVARVFHTGCQLGRGFEDSVGHFREKILRLPSLMYLETSRRAAEALASRVRSYLEWWLDEAGYP